MTTVIPQRAYATVTGPTATFVAPDGRAEPLTPTGGEDLRQAVVRRAADEARRTGTPVELVTAGDRGQHRLLIDPAGALTPISASSEETAPADATLRVLDPDELDTLWPQPAASDTAVDGWLQQEGARDLTEEQ